MPVVTRNRKNGTETKAEVPVKKAKQTTKVTSKKTKKSSEEVEAEDPKDLKEEKKVEEPEKTEEKNVKEPEKAEEKTDAKAEEEPSKDDKKNEDEEDRTAEGTILICISNLLDSKVYLTQTLFFLISKNRHKDDSKAEKKEEPIKIEEGGNCPDFEVSSYSL